MGRWGWWWVERGRGAMLTRGSNAVRVPGLCACESLCETVGGAMGRWGGGREGSECGALLTRPQCYPMPLVRTLLAVAHCVDLTRCLRRVRPAHFTDWIGF